MSKIINVLHTPLSSFVLAAALWITSVSISFAQSSTLYGVIKDQATGEQLPFATIQIKGTSIGVSSDPYGKFVLKNLQTGPQTFTVSYVGYEAFDFEIDIQPGNNEYNPILSNRVGLMQEVVVTGQYVGQAAAINQQINANTIVNVVSKDKIQELPDQNAAESVGRLPGIAIQREGGEGTKVVVRGLSPRFNSITVNGERIPSTDPADRSVDLSFLSPEALAGIEVFKALKPDMDADAIGGTVNFLPAKAQDNFEDSQIRASLGYNGLAEEFGQPRLNASAGDRFLDGRLGLLVTGNYQSANRSADILTQDFSVGTFGFAEDDITISLDGATLSDNNETRQRYGASVTLDYDFSPTSSIMLYSVWGETERDELRFRRSLNAELTRQSYQLRDRQRQTRVISNTLSGKHDVLNSWMEVTWRTSASISRQTTPFTHEMRFREDNAFELPEGFTPIDKSFEDFEPLLFNNLDQTYLQRGGARFDDDRVNEDAYTAQLDLKKDVSIGANVNGYIKAGGKVRLFDRSRDRTQFRDNGNGPENGLLDFVEDFPTEYQLDDQQRILISNFLSTTPNDDFLDGDFDLGVGLSQDLVNRHYEFFSDYYFRRDLIDNEDYESQEWISAGYLMGDFTINKLQVVGGVRVERTDGSYEGFETASGADDELGGEDEVTVDLVRRTNDIFYVELLPQVNLKYQVTDWFDVRGAVTKSLARPNFQNLVPWVQFNSNDNIVNRGNPNLRHTTAWNYDLFLSFYNRIGLFTIGGFYKQLDNIDVQSTSIAPAVGVEFPAATVIEPINLTSTSTVRGIELDVQTNLSTLPSPFDGIVLSANLTLLDSETFFPFFQRLGDNGPPLFTPEFVNVFRTGAVPGQPDLTANFSIGYEKGGFTGRISSLLQDNSLTEIGPNSESDSFADLLVRWDATLQQKVNKNLSFYFNWNNFTNAPIISFQFDEANETSRELFGFTMDLGLKYKF